MIPVRVLVLLAPLIFLAHTLPARAEVSEVRIAIGTGFGFLPLMVMQHERLIEKHARAAGLGNVKVSWTVLAGGAAQNDALLAGKIDFATSGVSTFLTLWAKTRGNVEAKGIASIGSMPIYLNTRNPKVKTIRDFTDSDRIAVPAVKVSPQAMLLQMAAAKEFGDANYGRLDPLTVSMSQVDAMTALLSGSGITAHFANPPIQFWELEQPGIRRVLNSYDVLGGPATFIMAWTTSRFRADNPRAYASFMAALEEASQLINRDKKAAAEIYRKVSNDRTPTDKVLKILDHPEMHYTTVPQNILKFAEFMHKVGSIKIRPASWKELFFPEAHGMPGS